MQYVGNRMASDHVNVFLIISAILIKDADRNVYRIPIAQRTKPALEINVLILVQELVDRMLIVALLTIIHRVHVALDTLAIHIDIVI